MKRITALFLVLCLSFLLCSCGEPSPIEKAQQRAVEIGEQYLNYELTAEEAEDQLDSIKVPETEGNGQSYLEGDIGYLGFLIIKNDSTYEEIQKKVESIKNSTYQ